MRVLGHRFGLEHRKKESNCTTVRFSKNLQIKGPHCRGGYKFSNTTINTCLRVGEGEGVTKLQIKYYAKKYVKVPKIAYAKIRLATLNSNVMEGGIDMGHPITCCIMNV